MDANGAVVGVELHRAVAVTDGSLDSVFRNLALHLDGQIGMNGAVMGGKIYLSG